jgi:hypothetical protein
LEKSATFEKGKELSMERRVTSHTEEEEMNQRRRLLTLARKGDQKAVELLFELYQVRVFSGEALKKKKLPSFPLPNQTGSSGRGAGKSGKKMGRIPKVSSPEAIAKPATAQESKKKPGASAKPTGKAKGPKPSPEKPRKKGRPVSSQKVAHKAGRVSKKAPVSKAKPQKPSMSARPTRVKKK